MKKEPNIEEHGEILKEMEQLLQEKQILEDKISVFTTEFEVLKMKSKDQLLLLQAKKGQLVNFEKLVENLNSLIMMLPKNSPIRKELLAQLYSNSIDKDWFISEIIMKSSLGKRYMESVIKEKSVTPEHLLIKYSIKTTRERWTEETKTSFIDTLDIIMPYRSGREYRIRQKNYQDTYGDYVRYMGSNFPEVRQFSYTVFWEKIRKRGDKIRFYKRSSWCSICVLIHKGDLLMEAIQSGDTSSIDFEYNDEWIAKYRQKKEHHHSQVVNQFGYYQRAKQRIFREQDLYSFV